MPCVRTTTGVLDPPPSSQLWLSSELFSLIPYPSTQLRLGPFLKYKEKKSLCQVKSSLILAGQRPRPSLHWLTSDDVKRPLKEKHSLAVFTLEAEEHPFPTDRARLRHPVLGGKPVGKEQEGLR